MAVTLLSNPLGHKLATVLYDAAITNSAGDALVTHSATVEDGAWVYIESNFERYSGFKYVVEISPTTFKFRDKIGGDEVAYIQDSDVTFQISVLDHSWQSVHLPIVYELVSDLFPTNSVDTERTVSSFTDLNGYTYITASGSLGSFEALDFVKITGAASPEVNGVFQIIFRNAGDIFSIDLAYDSGYSFSGATIQLYKSNYFISVEVYSGLESGHRWYAQKPTQLVATLLLIPDENNQVKFSIAEILKGNINTRNNLQLDTLPNNLDFYTQFHIAFMESYDVADAGEIVVFEGSLTVDSFIGNAVNSQMPFKSVNESFMSDYLAFQTSLSRWLTLLDRPVAVNGYFFDLSFLLSNEGDVNVTIFKSSAGIVTSTEVIAIDNPGTGVIRVPITPESGYDLYCIQASIAGSNEALDLTTFANTSSGVDWSTGVPPAPYVLVSTSQSSKILFQAYSFIVGVEYVITATFNYTVSATFGTIRLSVYDASNNIIETQTEPIGSGAGPGSIALTFTATDLAARIGIRANQINIPGDTEFTINTVNVLVSGSDVTEQICIDIIEECGNTLTNDNLRITENGIFREIE